jgi:hypothetical protein
MIHRPAKPTEPRVHARIGRLLDTWRLMARRGGSQVWALAADQLEELLIELSEERRRYWAERDQAPVKTFRVTVRNYVHTKAKPVILHSDPPQAQPGEKKGARVGPGPLGGGDRSS